MSNALAYCHEGIYQFCMDPDEDDLQNDPIDVAVTMPFYYNIKNIKVSVGNLICN